MERNNIPDELQTIWNEAKACIERDDYDKAIEIYKYILLRYGDDAISTKYANAYLGERRHKFILRKLLMLTPRNLPIGTRWVLLILSNRNGRVLLRNLKLQSQRIPIAVNIFEG